MAEVTENVETTVANETPNLANNPYVNSANNNTLANVDQANAGANPLTAITSNFDTNKFLIGLAIGAAGAYLLTNENAQKSLFKTFAKGSELFTAGIEEIKERFEDAKAEMEAAKS